MLSLPTFLKNGGTLGFNCAHQHPNPEVGTYNYPHVRHSLKGIDAALFSIFRMLGPTFLLYPNPWGQSGSRVARLLDLITIEEETQEGKVRR
jgi:hypothetical protein